MTDPTGVAQMVEHPAFNRGVAGSRPAAGTEYILFLADTFGNDAGDLVRVEDVDEANVYYTDGFDRWCYLERDNPAIVVIEARDKRQARRLASKVTR